MDAIIKDKIVKALERVTHKNMSNLDFSADLSSQLTLDSIQIVELFASLEAEFETELPLSLMTVRTGDAFFQQLKVHLAKIEFTR